jgi:hypothetical protein
MTSNEAETALARVSRRKALERLRRAGAESRPAMQRRVRALAEERKIPPADFHKLMYKRPSTQAVIDFCKKHSVNCDWLLCGDLKGLQQMTQEAKAAPKSSPRILSSQEFVEALLSLDEKNRQSIISYMQLLIGGGGVA